MHHLKIVNTPLKSTIGPTLQTSLSKLSEKLNMQLNFIRPNSSWVLDQNNILLVLINNSRTTWCTSIELF